MLHDVLAAVDRLEHTLGVEMLALHPEVGLLEGVLPIVNGVNDLRLHLASVWMSQGSCCDVTISIVVDAGILSLHEGIVHPGVVLVGLLGILLLLLHALLVLIEVDDGSAEEQLKVVNELSILGHLGGVLILIELEVKAVLFKDLQRCLDGKVLEHRVDFARLASKDLELSTFNQKVVSSKLTEESLQKGASFFDELCLA